MNSLETNNTLCKKPNILIVDDQPANIQALSGILQEENTIMVATSGAKALKIARGEKKPNLILLDVLMPEMDGYEVLRRLKADEKTRDIPVIFVTVKDAEGDEEFGLELGAEDYISKPYIPGVVKVRVKQLLERKQAEEELIKLSTAVNQSSSAIVITDTEGIIQYVNSAFEKLTGYSSSEALGENPRILKSGRQSNEFYEDLWDTISGGNTWKGKIVNRKKDGSFYTEDTSISPVFSEKGEITNYVAVKIDITKEENLQEQLRQSQKMESVGRLAGGVAHDYNNMLTVILNYVELTLRKLDKSDDVHEFLVRIKEAAERSARVTNQLLAFARKQVYTPKVLNLNTVIKDMTKMLEKLVGENITIQWHPQENLWPVKMDPSQVDQIIANLCINARDAIEGNGIITIETSNASIDENYTKEKQYFSPGDYTVITVSDNGCGMDKKTVENIFEPFFTTKEVGEATGLGLATVYGIVKQNGGFINVYSEIDEGTTFRIYLKRESEEAEKAEKVQKVVPTESKGETVLVVEDEEAILQTIEKVFETLGYNLLTANNPLEALDIAEKHSGDIDVIVTDVVMPDMNGKKMSEKITKLHPNAKVLFMSGYPYSVIGQHGLSEEDVNFIQKPFQVKDLEMKIREILDKE
ncbi:multi-sensor hybrid histidine kinase [Flexistipes sinusarabici DSM 4947]|uniref:histidine kinase n=1 Tax=Flexistipes sinusarabici (strain ATCC 49648 / DSM 4947 / MAS 10) TaxID=717231 RepID=F8E4F2_FLESM|nr:response regulator [Flexistipes sinusarabici]AEI14438.1 multi-sensor hybrid histidine kinase [Flexistipes sinusarabici DSM 4947]